jgi:hypothetical protein
MLDLSVEQPLPLAAATKLIPAGRGGKKTHISTLIRWILRGVQSLSGETVHLEALRLGNRWVTSREAIQSFAERLPPTTDAPPPPRPRTATARRRASEHAGHELDKIGI